MIYQASGMVQMQFDRMLPPLFQGFVKFAYKRLNANVKLSLWLKSIFWTEIGFETSGLAKLFGMLLKLD